MTEQLDNRYRRLKDHRFPEILLDISVSKKTGTLHLKNWPAEKLIHMKKGRIIFATSNMEEDCLGINLLAKGKITVVQYYESIRLLEKKAKRHGSILVDLGFLSKKDIEHAVREQVEGIILSIFKWEDGYFYFDETPFYNDEPIKLNADIIALIYNGIKNMDSFPQIRNALPFTTILAKSLNVSRLSRKLSFTPFEKKIVNLIDGKKTVLDILESFEGKDFEALKVLYALNSITAAVHIGDTDAKRDVCLSAEKSSPEDPCKKGRELFAEGKFDASAASFREATNLNPDNASCYFYLAMSLINSSHLNEAEDALTRAIKIEPFNDNYYTELGMLYFKKGISEKACRALEFALRINPHNEKARKTLSEARK